MYRSYENPKELEERLARVEKWLFTNEKNLENEEIYETKLYIDDLKGRVNHAWMDLCEDNEE